MKIALCAKTYLMSRKNVIDEIKYYWTWNMIYYWIQCHFDGPTLCQNHLLCESLWLRTPTWIKTRQNCVLSVKGYIFIIPTWRFGIHTNYIGRNKNQMHIFCRVNVVLLKYSTNKHDYEYYIHIATNIYDIDLVKQLL